MLSKVYKASLLVLDAYAKQMALIGVEEEIQSYLIHKIKHTFAVAYCIRDLMMNEKTLIGVLSKEDRELVELSAVLHDLCRFYQFDENGKYMKDFKHGEEAVKILKDNPEFNDPKLLFAIGQHDKIAVDYSSSYYVNLSDEDKKIAKIMAELLRDADKLDNIEDSYNSGLVKFKVMEEGSLSDGVKKCIANKALVEYKFIKTYADMIVSELSWLNDMNFEFTKKKIKDLGYIDKNLKYLAEFGGSSSDIEFVKENIDF